ncbi:MAG: hypothetical protein ACPGO5_03015 [Patescibacteria group bacterium]
MSTNNLAYLAGQVQKSLQRRREGRKKGRRSKKVRVSSEDVKVALAAMSDNGMKTQAFIVMMRYRLTTDGHFDDRLPIKGRGLRGSGEIYRDPDVRQIVKVFLKTRGDGQAFSDLVTIVGHVK